MLNSKKSNILFIFIQILSLTIMVMCVLGVFITKDDDRQARYFFNFFTILWLFLVTFIPRILKKKIKLAVPDPILVIFLVFCICHFLLGEAGHFYLYVPHWDTMLHLIGGAVTAILGFCLIGLFNDIQKIDVKLSPFFLALFAICFTITVGVVWEIFEFASDVITGSNMQRYMDSVTGEVFVGIAALKDTMKDLILESISAVVVGMIYIFNTKFRDSIDNFKMKRIRDEENKEVNKTVQIEE
ncbi:MAG: hypothetical protein R3Y21_04145 [Mycoplasmatota bacterium]